MYESITGKDFIKKSITMEFSLVTIEFKNKSEITKIALKDNNENLYLFDENLWSIAF